MSTVTVRPVMIDPFEIEADALEGLLERGVERLYEASRERLSLNQAPMPCDVADSVRQHFFAARAELRDGRAPLEVLWRRGAKVVHAARGDGPRVEIRLPSAATVPMVWQAVSAALNRGGPCRSTLRPATTATWDAEPAPRASLLAEGTSDARALGPEDLVAFADALLAPMKEALARPINVTLPAGLVRIEPQAVTVNVPPQPPPVIHFSPIVNVAAPEPEPEPVKKVVELKRDHMGRVESFEILAPPS